MPGRQFSIGGYRFGFNGKEMDNEVEGNGNQYDYGFRIYNPRLARFLSVDPLTNKYAELTPYQFASNRPIDCIDIDGLESGAGAMPGAAPLPGPMPGPPVGPATAPAAGAGAVPGGAPYTPFVPRAPYGAPYRQAETQGYFERAAGLRIEYTRTGNTYLVRTRANTQIQTKAAVEYKPLRPLEQSLADASFEMQMKKSGNVLFRFDTRSPEEISMQGGFSSWGYNMNLWQHVTGVTVRDKTSGFISTSKSYIAVLNEFWKGRRDGYLYVIRYQPTGRDVNSELGAASPFPQQQEVAVPNRINFGEIIMYIPLKKQKKDDE